jgi:hypothetical protein
MKRVKKMKRSRAIKSKKSHENEGRKEREVLMQDSFKGNAQPKQVEMRISFEVRDRNTIHKVDGHLLSKVESKALRPEISGSLTLDVDKKIGVWYIPTWYNGAWVESACMERLAGGLAQLWLFTPNNFSYFAQNHPDSRIIVSEEHLTPDYAEALFRKILKDQITFIRDGGTVFTSKRTFYPRIDVLPMQEPECGKVASSERKHWSSAPPPEVTTTLRDISGYEAYINVILSLNFPDTPKEIHKKFRLKAVPPGTEIDFVLKGRKIGIALQAHPSLDPDFVTKFSCFAIEYPKYHRILVCTRQAKPEAVAKGIAHEVFAWEDIQGRATDLIEAIRRHLD